MGEGKGHWAALFVVVNTLVETTYQSFFGLSVQGGKDITHEPVCEQEIQ